MTFRDFDVPEDVVVTDATGLLPEVRDDGTARYVTIPGGAGNEVLFSYDVFERSIRLRWLEQGQERLEIYRDAATRLRFEYADGTYTVRTTFTSDELVGELTVEVSLERVRVTDKMLVS